MKTPEQWLEEFRLYGDSMSDITTLRLIRDIQKDAADSRSSQLWDELEHPIKWKDDHDKP